MANGTNIDSLDIQISASSEGVVRQLNNIARAMTAIKTASSGNVGRGLQEAIRTINNLSVQKVGALADALGKLKGISINSKLADNLMDFEAAVSLIAEKKGAVESIERITSALGRLRGVNLTGFSSATGKIGNTKGANFFRGMTADQVTAMSKTEMLKAKIDALKASLQEKMDTGVIDDKGIANAAQQIQKLTEQYEKLTQATKEAAEESEKISAPSESSEGTVDDVSEATKKASKIARLFASFKNVAKGEVMSKVTAITGGLGGPAGIALAAASTALTGILNLLKKAASLVWNIAKGIAKWAFHTAVEALNKMWNLLKKMPGAIAKVVGTVGKGLSSAVGTIGRGIASIGRGIGQFAYEHSAVKKLTDSFDRLKKVLSSFTRVAFYRIVRSAIKFVTDALEEGSNNAYYFAKKFGDSTNYISERMDILATSTGKMRNQVGAAWATLIATVEPLLLRLLELVTRAASIVTQFFGAMGGKSTYLKAKSFPKTWAEDAEEAADKTKEWKNQLMDFDTLNRLNEKLEDAKDESNLPNYEEMFEEVPIEPWITELKDLLKLEDLLEKFDGEHWYTIGLKLGNNINDLLDDIDDKIITITPQLENLTGNITYTLNGILDGVDWYKLGKTLADGVNGLLKILDKFYNGLDWKNLGNSLAGALNGLIDNVDWVLLGKTVGEGINSIFTAIDEFLTNVKWKELGRGLGTSIKTMFDTVDWDLVGRTFAHGWNALLYIIEGIVTTPGIWESMGKSIGQFVHAWFSEIDIDSLASSLIAIINGVATAIENFLEQNPFANISEKLTNAIQRIITEVQWGYVGEQFGKLFQEVLNQINTVIFGTDWVAFGTSLGTMLNNFIANIDFNMLGQTLVGVFTSALNILYGVLITPGFAANLATSLSNFMLGALTQLADWLESLDPALIAGAIRDFFGNIKYEEIKDAFVRVIKAAWNLAMSIKEELFPDGLLPTVTGYIRTWFDSLDWDKISETIKTCVDEAWTLAMEALDFVEEIAKIGWEIGKRFAAAIGEKFSEWWHGTTLGMIFDFIKVGMDPTGALWETVYRLVKGGGQKVSHSVAEGVTSEGQTVVDAMDNALVKPADSAVTAFLKSIGLIGPEYEAETSAWDAVSKTLKDDLTGYYDQISTDVPASVNKLVESFRTGFGNITEAVSESLKGVAESIQENLSESKFMQSAKNAMAGFISGISDGMKDLSGLFSSMVETFSGVGENLVNSMKSGFSSMWNSFNSMVSELVSTLVGGISSTIQQGFSGLGSAIGTAVSDASGKLQELAGKARSSINTVLEDSKTSLNGIVSSIQSAVNSIISQANSILSRISGRSYATGGFPEDGLFYANHGELVGKFSNGKTAVANNEQIISGIEQGVFRAMSMVMGTNRGDDGGVINVYVGDELVYSGYSKWNKRQQLMAGGRA